jgi:integrating conjugative element relaxase (TIGR03760 family)
MLSLFQRKRLSPTPTPSAPPIEMPKGLTRPQSAESLLATPRRKKLLEHIWQRTSLSRRQFATLYLAPMERYAELVQQFPASENHHHAYPGGMLDHGLEIVAYALKLRQSHLLPAGAPPEAQAAQAEAWTAGAAYAALLHDIGKLAVDLHVEYGDGSIWRPWHGSLKRPYRFRYRKEREYRLHSAATGLLYARVLDREIFDWLSGYPDLWAALLYVLAGQYEHAGTLGELVIQADRASVAQEMGGDPTKVVAAPRHALQRKLLDGLRYLLKEEFKLNQPQASDGWLTQDALWLVSKTVSDKLRAHLLSQGIDGIPTGNVALFNVLQDHGIAQATPQGKAIWKATVTGDTGWSHSFTFLKLAPALIWESVERPTPFSGTVQVDHDAGADPASTEEGDKTGASETGTEAANSVPVSTRPSDPRNSGTMTDGVDALLGLLGTADVQSSPTTDATSPPAQVTKTESVAEPSVTPAGLGTTNNDGRVSGEHFMDWLKRGVQSRKLIINDAKALIHTVADTAYLVSPGIFQRYAQEHPQTAFLAKQDKAADWQWVQKRFEKLHLHRKQSDGLNIWTCEVAGPRKSRRLHGYLLEDGSLLFNEMPLNNPYLALLSTSQTCANPS